MNMDDISNLVPARSTIILEVQGASEQDMAVGLQAAQAVFEREGVSAYKAFTGMGMVAAHLNDLLEASPEAVRAVTSWSAWCRQADVWCDAENAALDVACQNLPDGKSKYRFRLEWEDRQAKESDTEWWPHNKGAVKLYQPRFSDWIKPKTY